MSCQHLKCAFLSTLVRTPPVPNDHEVFPCSYSVHFCRLFRSLPTGKNLPSSELWGLSLTCYCAASVKEFAQPRLFQSFSSILCANSHSHRRPDRIARRKPAASDPDGSTTDIASAAPVKCDLDRVCVDQARTAASCRLSDRICETRSA